MSFTLYTKVNCSACSNAKRFLEAKGLDYTTLNVPTDADTQMIQERVTEAGSDHIVKTVPQIFLGEKYIGGVIDLVSFVNGWPT